VVHDVHELGPAEARRQLKLLVMRGPLELRLVLASRQDVRHDVRLGLHQLRLEASSCSAQELTAPDTEQSSHGLRVP
jgi:LuxR family maltose regulon positive regulatory protein